jgi:hypothetical protein
MDNWGAFIFFAGWCFIALVYVFLMVPETAGHSLEELDRIFEGSWFMAFRSKAGTGTTVIEGRQDGYVTSEHQSGSDQDSADKS